MPDALLHALLINVAILVVGMGMLWRVAVRIDPRYFRPLEVDGVQCRTDGIRVDVNGNLWCGSNAGRTLGYSGVTVWSPDGKILGRIRLPETCANLCFGGPKRNRLFMCASQSLYSVYVETQGAHIT